MSKLSELIKELCPNGVEYKMLGDIAEMQRGTPMTKKDAREGDVPVISGGREPAYYCDLSNRAGETITVAGSGAGAGYVQYWNTPIFVCDAFSVKGCANVDTKYLYYCLSSCQDYIYSTKKGGGVPHVHISNIENMRIPLPPLKIQQEIVKILDKFTELQAELQAELDLRLKQYEYYRDELLSFDKLNNLAGVVRRVRLGDIATIIRGGNFQKKDFVDEGQPCIHYGQIYTRYKTYADEVFSFVNDNVYQNSKKASKNDIIMAVTSENIEDVCKCVAWLGDEEVAVSGHTAIIKHRQNPKYLAYYFSSGSFFKQKGWHTALR